MPLIHSKKPAAFSKNVSAEMHAGKPQKQAVAIAYSVQRKAQHHKAHGGEIEDCPLCNGGKMDEGGEILDKSEGVGAEGSRPGEDDELHEQVGHEIMEAIHSKDHKKLMSGIEALVLHHMNKRED